MRSTRQVITALAVVLAIVFATVVAFGSRSTSAQTTTGTPSATMHDHPAHIHAGTCDTLGDVVFPLNNLMAPGMGGTPTAGMMMATPMAGGMMADVVAESTSTVEATLDEILGGEHAINVHESPENIGNYIACGELTGTATGGQLQIQLEELNDSGYQGQAMLMDNGDGTTTVTVMLTMTDMGMMASPAAS
jgi:hypothetical protein